MAGRAVLSLRLPRPADITVRRNGAAIDARCSAQLDLDIADEGAYRVEARIDGRLWLLYTPSTCANSAVTPHRLSTAGCGGCGSG